jgi:hypothetical protein
MNNNVFNGPTKPMHADRGAPTASHRFQTIVPLRAEDKEIMALHPVQTKEGTLFLYDEYAGTPERFNLGPRKCIESRYCTRNIYAITPDDGSPKFIAKKERAPEDKYRRKFGERDNLALKEIMIARALSKFVAYEDEEFVIRFERPIGYFEDRLGQRFAFFEHMEGLGGAVLYPDIRHISDLCKKASIAKMDNVSEPDRERWDKLDRVRALAYSVLLPFQFSDIILTLNGIAHNEILGKDGTCLDNGRLCVPVIDFEFCKALDRDTILSVLKHRTRHIFDKWALEFCDVIADPGLESRLAAGCARMEMRIKDYLGIGKPEDVYSLGNLGPAYELLKGAISF